MDPRSDHNLLVGMLALQANFVSQDQLLSAFRVWVADKQQSLADIFLKQQAVDQETLELLLALVAKHIQLHGNQPALSLAALSSSSVREAMTKTLGEVQDSDLNHSLTLLHAAQAGTVREPAFFSTANEKSSDSRLGRFSIIRPHAKGGLGEVFVAFDHELNRQVALKEIQGRFAFDEASRQRFMLEAEITGGLEHPGIVPVYGLGTYSDGRPFYAMRFIKGNSLATAGEKFHSEHPSPTPEDYRGSEFRKLLRRFVDVCFSIEYAHSRGVLHRDLKPGNIMLGKYGETLVVDWGLAKAQESPERSGDLLDEETLRPSSGADSSQTRMGQAVGTPAYMSPEAAAGQLERIGPASDVYCLGATLYFLIAGKAPFHRHGIDSLESVKKGQFPPPRELNRLIPKSLESICLHAMRQNPDQRYASAKALADDVELWLADEPTSVSDDPLSVRLGRFVRRNKAAVTSAGIFGLLLLLAVTVFAWIVSQKNSQLAVAYDKAQNNLRRAEEQRNRAEKNSETARGMTLDVIRIAERQLSSFTGQEGFREEMMDRAYELLSDLRDQNPQSTGLTWELANVSRLSGNVKLKLRKLDDARRLLRQSIDLQRGLNRTDVASRDYLVSTLRDLGSFAKVVGDLQLATESFASASELLDELQLLAPDDEDLLRTSGSLDLERVGLYLELLDNQSALEAAERCESIYLRLAKTPTVRDLDYVVALLATARRGQTLFSLGRVDEARQVYEAGVERGREWIERSSMVDVRYGLARVLLYFAHDLAKIVPLPDETLRLVDEAIERFDILVETRGGVTYRYYLACAHRTKAIVEQASSRLPEAEAEFNQAIQSLEELVEESPKATYYTVLAECYALKAKLIQINGDHAAAKELLSKAISQQKVSVEMNPNSLQETRSLADYERQMADF